MAMEKVKYKLPDMGTDWLYGLHMYVILSLKHSTPEVPQFWMGNDCGYTEYIFNCGMYTPTQVSSNPLYYNDGINAVAIPLTGTALRKLGFKVTIDYTGLDAFANRAIDATKVL